jgi:hypothetical protein
VREKGEREKEACLEACSIQLGSNLGFRFGSDLNWASQYVNKVWPSNSEIDGDVICLSRDEVALSPVQGVAAHGWRWDRVFL